MNAVLQAPPVAREPLAPPEAERTPRRRLDDPAALALLALACAVLAVLTWGRWGAIDQDTGYELLAGSRVAGGETPYADFTYFYGPVGPYALGALFALFGTGVGPAIGLGLALALACTGLTYAVARELVAPAPALAAAVLAATTAFGVGNTSFVLPHAISAPLSIALALAMILALARLARTRERRWALLAGAAVGVMLLARPDMAAYVAPALGAWLAARRFAGHERWSRVLGDAGWIAAAAVALPVLVYVPLAIDAGLDPLLFDNLFPRDVLAAGSGKVLTISAPLTAGSFATLAGRLALYALGAAALVAVAMLGERRGDAGRAARLALVGGAAGYLLVLAARPELTRHALEFAYGWIPAGAIAAVVWLVWRMRRDRPFGPRAQVELLLCTLLALVAARTYAAFFPHPLETSQQAAYAMPLAAVFLVWLHSEARRTGSRMAVAAGIGWIALLAASGAFLAVKDGRSETVTVRGPHGSLTATPEDGRAYQAAVDAIVGGTRPGDPVLVAPQMSALYVLTGRRDPLPELSLLPGALASPAAEREAIERMRRVRIAVTDGRPYTEYGAGAFGTGDFHPLLGEWLRRDFGRPSLLGASEAQSRTLDLWARSATNP